MNKDNLIELLAIELNIAKSESKKILQALEDIVFRYIKSTPIGAVGRIHLLKGFYIISCKDPEMEKKNNLTGENVLIPPRIRVRTNITKTFKEIVNKVDSDAG